MILAAPAVSKPMVTQRAYGPKSSFRDNSAGQIREGAKAMVSSSMGMKNAIKKASVA